MARLAGFGDRHIPIFVTKIYVLPFGIHGLVSTRAGIHQKTN